MKADPRRIPEDGAGMRALQEIFEGLADPLELEDRVGGGFWDAAFLDPLRDILSRPGKRFRGQLTEHTWGLAGGDPERFPPALARAVELLHAGSLVIDDIEDDSRTRRGQPTLHRRYGLPLALNTGNLLYFLALEHLARIPISEEGRASLYDDVTSALVRCHQGQALDLSVRITEERRTDVFALVDAATRLKTGSLMRLAAVLGVRAAGGDPELREVLGRFGTELGVGLQMLDDWSGISIDSRREKGIEDIQLARPTWPWAWLAEAGDELAYAETARQARALSIEWQADRVRERLESLLSPAAPDLIRGQLDRALSGLDGALGESAEVAAIEDEVEGLVRAFQGA